MTAAEEMVFFLDCFIDLYQNHKDILRFNRNFFTYVRHEHVTKEKLKDYTDVVGEFAARCHALYQKAQKDGTLKVDLPEKKFFASTLHIMLSVSEKYAEGLIYPPDTSYEEDLTDELVLLKNMILRAYQA